MKFKKLLDLVGRQPFFDLATLVQLSDAPRQTLLTQLHRFVQAGKLVPLRRGMYMLAEPYGRTSALAPEVANFLHRPSYLSSSWALSYYGIIPEYGTIFTSITTRSPRRYQNALGEFRYRSVKQSVFFGYASVELGGRKVVMASPEKALVDFWYLERGEWTQERMEAMRFATTDVLDDEALDKIVSRLAKPRLTRALRVWRALRDEKREGEIEL